MTTCQICGHKIVASDKTQTIIDYSVTGEAFSLTKCNNCEALQTDAQQIKDMNKYYESRDYVSHGITIYNPIHQVYNIARFFTTKSKLRLLQELSEKNKILDYGCGTGNFLAKLQKAGYRIKGIEPSDKARKAANIITNGMVLANLTELKETFDIITLWHVLEHTSNPLETIRLLLEKLNPQGKIIIAIPNYKSNDAEYYQEYWAGYDVPRHLWHLTRKTIKILSGATGLTIKQEIPMKLDSYYVSLLSEKYKSGNKRTALQIYRAMKNGWLSNKAAKNTGEYSSLIYVLSR